MSKNSALDEFTPVQIQPRYHTDRNGVFYIGIQTDKEGNAHEKPPLRLSDRIAIIGRGADNAGSHYRVIQWTDNITRQTKTAALPMAEIGTNAGWQMLQSHGITVLSGRHKRELLADYLQTDGATTPYTVTDKAGWHDRTYILPNGEIIGQSDSGRRIIYNGDTSQAHAYTVSGSLKDWQREARKTAAIVPAKNGVFYCSQQENTA